ncbi:MAG: hypothetical protein K0S99_1812 [Thermomicrobiales bacterium]|jgi:hypothetical protein|nr:hypothetical protein [Thermomicrobiales bacterium]
MIGGNFDCTRLAEIAAQRLHVSPEAAFRLADDIAIPVAISTATVLEWIGDGYGVDRIKEAAKLTLDGYGEYELRAALYSSEAVTAEGFAYWLRRRNA